MASKWVANILLGASLVIFGMSFKGCTSPIQIHSAASYNSVSQAEISHAKNAHLSTNRNWFVKGMPELELIFSPNTSVSHLLSQDDMSSWLVKDSHHLYIVKIIRTDVTNKLPGVS